MAKRKSTRIKKISLEQFRSWLEGVESMQPDDWTPSLDQWNKIREQISAIKDTPVETQVSSENIVPPTTALYRDAVQNNTVGLPPPVRTIPPTNQPLTTKLDKTLPPTFAEPGKQVSTPNIDTSDGSYDSSFV